MQNKTKWLTLASIVLIPFYEVAVKLLPNGVVVTQNTRDAKTFLATGLALLIGMIGLNEIVPRMRNKWIPALLLYMFFAVHLGCKPLLIMNNINATQFWVWKPLFMSLCFYLMYLVISNIEYIRTEIELIFKVSVWSAVAMGAYVFLQWLGVDFYYHIKNGQVYEGVTNGHLTGNLGQPTLVAPYMAMMVPMAIVINKKLLAGILAFTVVLTQSVTAIVAMVFGCALMVCIKRKVLLSVLIASMLIGGIGVGFMNINDNGRFGTWKNVVTDWKTTPLEKGENFGTFGSAIGSFKFFYPQKHKSGFHQAHNEYLQILYSLGIVGASLFCLILWQTFQRAYVIQGSEYLYGLIGSFACLCVCAVGTFVWQLAVYQYMSVLIVGLIYNSLWEDIK